MGGREESLNPERCIIKLADRCFASDTDCPA